MTETSVNKKALADFGTKTLGGPGGGNGSTLQDFQQGTGDPMGKIGSARPGMVGSNEAVVFRDWYFHAINDALSQLMKDAPKGLMALGGGAIVMAANYEDGDVSQANAVDKVYDMFNASPDTPSLDHDLATNAKNVDKKTKVNNQDLLDKEAPPNPVAPPPGQETPLQKAQDQVKQHQDQYGDDEHWRPPSSDHPTPHPTPGPPPSTPQPTPDAPSTPPSSPPPSTPQPTPGVPPPTPQPTPTSP